MADIAKRLKISHSQVVYWMNKYNFKRRTNSGATYVKANPHGDPFSIKTDLDRKEIFLKGQGLGLYWGEGTKKCKSAVKISNSDPELIKVFLEFLRKIYQIQEKRLKFTLHLFFDINPEEAIQHWVRSLGIPREKFLKPQIINLKRVGTYQKKSRYGVATLIFHNKKLRDVLIKEVKSLKSSCG